jgi:hypothetical protein
VLVFQADSLHLWSGSAPGARPFQQECLAR